MFLQKEFTYDGLQINNLILIILNKNYNIENFTKTYTRKKYFFLQKKKATKFKKFDIFLSGDNYFNSINFKKKIRRHRALYSFSCRCARQHLL